MKRRLLAFLKISEHPDPPPGSTAEGLETFRPSRRFFYYTVLRWLPKQASTLFGILLSLALLGGIELNLGNFDITSLDDIFLVGQLEDVTVGLGPVRFELGTAIRYLEILAIGAFLVQFVLGGLLLQLGWEMRWYMVGEQALRIRSGLWHLREQTMTIANIQNMTIRQGPVQKLFGIADLEIHTAGGGAKKDDDDEKPDHVGRFEGLENAEELRRRLRSRLVRDRGTGVGDVVEEAEVAAPVGGASSGGALTAARQLLEEARALRLEAGGASKPGS